MPDPIDPNRVQNLLSCHDPDESSEPKECRLDEPTQANGVSELESLVPEPSTQVCRALSVPTDGARSLVDKFKTRVPVVAASGQGTGGAPAVASSGGAPATASNEGTRQVPNVPADEPVYVDQSGPMTQPRTRGLGVATGVSIESTLQVRDFGGTLGLNLEYTPDDGLALYAVLPVDADDVEEGFDLGVSLTGNVAIGSGEWRGDFDNVGDSAGPFTDGAFRSPGYNPLTDDTGWAGLAGGVGDSPLPGGMHTNRTHYVEVVNVSRLINGAGSF